MSEESEKSGYSHEEMELLLREKGLTDAAALTAALKEAEDALAQGPQDIEQAIAQVIGLTRKTGSSVVMAFAKLEAEVLAIKSRLDSIDGAQ